MKTENQVIKLMSQTAKRMGSLWEERKKQGNAMLLNIITPEIQECLTIIQTLNWCIGDDKFEYLQTNGEDENQ